MIIIFSTGLWHLGAAAPFWGLSFLDWKVGMSASPSNVKVKEEHIEVGDVERGPRIG